MNREPELSAQSITGGPELSTQSAGSMASIDGAHSNVVGNDGAYSNIIGINGAHSNIVGIGI
jgi:hypothetical protein